MTRPTQFGSHCGTGSDATGTNFTVVSRHADAVELCLFDRPDSAAATRRVKLRPSRRRGEDSVWWTHLPDVGPGALYGYRVHGPFAPQNGHVFNSSKLLLDPWARAVTGRPRISEGLTPAESGLWGLRGTQPDEGGRFCSEVFDSTDSAGSMPKCVVVGPDEFDWQGVSKPRIPWSETFIYEAHVKGLTRLHPDVPEELRGTYLGLAQEPVLDHLRSLGVTAVELMPVLQSAPEDHLLRSGRPNYWGYSTVCFFAPDAAYAVDPLGGQADQFKTMVRELHRAGIEVIIDVVYNHTAEGGRFGPFFSLKGLDQALFYRVGPDNPRRHQDFSGCGNTLDVNEPVVRELILDSLCYWATEMQVDGFRFDLAPALARNPDGEFGDASPLFEAMALDPALDGVKWIAEPWDVPPAGKPSGYRLGRFPAGWGEWNDRFRDGARRFWRGDTTGQTSVDLALRLAGSGDVFGDRAPLASVNFVAAHDGFTLADLSSYDQKHNEANGEDNRDGSDHNLSRNWGVEGATDDPDVEARRALHRRNLLATLFLSRGVPMLGHGDEMGRSQGGNNNAYCHDDETTWLDWSTTDEDLLAWTGRLSSIRRRFPQLREGRSDDSGSQWLDADGCPIDPEDWGRDDLVSFVWVLPGLCLLIHGGSESKEFRLPPQGTTVPGVLLADSARPDRQEDESPMERVSYRMAPSSIALVSMALIETSCEDPLP